MTPADRLHFYKNKRCRERDSNPHEHTPRGF